MFKKIFILYEYMHKYDTVVTPRAFLITYTYAPYFIASAPFHVTSPFFCIATTSTTLEALVQPFTQSSTIYLLRFDPMIMSYTSANSVLSSLQPCYKDLRVHTLFYTRRYTSRRFTLIGKNSHGNKILVPARTLLRVQN